MYADCLATIGRIHEARSEYNRALEVIQMHRGEEVDEVLDIYEALEALPTTPEFSVIVGETDREFVFNFKMENIKIIKDSYDVIISSKLLAQFTNENHNLKYFIALEPDSTFTEK